MSTKHLMASREWVKSQIADVKKRHTEVTSEEDKPTEGNKSGDTCVVKTEISPGKYSYKAYVFDTDNGWRAMDGNYSADNVFLDEDFTLAGNYTNVGNVKLTDNTLSAKGISVKDLLTAIFTKELEPTTVNGGSVSIAFTNNNEYEYGTKVAPKYKATFNAGSFTYGSVNAEGVHSAGNGISLTSLKIVGSGGTQDPAVSGTEYTSNTEIYIGVDTSFKVKAVASWSASNTPATNLKKASKTKNALAAVTDRNSTEITFGTNKAYRNIFWYVGTNDTATIDNAFLRHDTGTETGHGKAKNSGTTKDLSVAAGDKIVVIAIPGVRVLKSVIDVDGMGLDIKGNFISSTVNVEGANGKGATPYTVFKFANDFGKTTLKFTWQ